MKLRLRAYFHASSQSASGAAEIASVKKESKYSALPLDYIFQAVALETLGILNWLRLFVIGRPTFEYCFWRPSWDLFSLSASVNFVTAL